MGARMKVRDWPERFDAVLDEYRRTAFRWGERDCVTFAFDDIQAVTGARLPVDITWSSEEEARAVIDQFGGLVAGFTAHLGAPVSPLLCTAGDIGITAAPDGSDALCVCGGRSWLALGSRGLVSVDQGAVSVAWRL
jgi:hypothetical protein